MSAIPDTETESLDMALIGVLYPAVNRPTRATVLMTRAGIKFSIREPFGQGGKYVHPHSAFVQFCCAMSRIARVFAGHGFAVRKTGGTPFDDVWIEPHGLSS